MLDFSVLKVSGLRQIHELDVLFGVSRVTINSYANSKRQPRGENMRRAAIALQVINALIERKKLPLREGRDEEERSAIVAKIKTQIDTLLTQ